MILTLESKILSDAAPKLVFLIDKTGLFLPQKPDQQITIIGI